MNSKILGFLLVFFSASFNHQVIAQDDISIQQILATAKIAGACGILDSLITFQQTTRMDGGDEFVSRFWAVESARLGITVDQLSERCNNAVTLYDKFWQSMESDTQ